jgi:hypothetical protein
MCTLRCWDELDFISLLPFTSQLSLFSMDTSRASLLYDALSLAAARRISLHQGSCRRHSSRFSLTARPVNDRR